MRILVAEKLSPHKYKTPEGYLICQDAILARTGKQTYLNREVYGDSIDDPNKEIEIDRPEAEVFSDKTLASFENKPVTIEHPDEDVNIDNHNFYSVGFVRDIKRGIDDGKPVMIGTLVVTNPDAVADIENGKLLELSCGYDCDIVDNAQTNIRGNHVALCEHGRAGNARIVDSVTLFRKNMIKGEKSMKLCDDDLSCCRAGIIDSKCKDFDNTGKNIRVVKEFIEQNGNKFDKRKDADAILEYIKKRTGIANADYGDVLYIIKEYTRAEITDSVKDSKVDDAKLKLPIGYIESTNSMGFHYITRADHARLMPAEILKIEEAIRAAGISVKQVEYDISDRWVRYRTSGRFVTHGNIDSMNNISSRLDDDIHTHFRKIEEDAKFLYQEYQKGNKSPNEILSSRGYKDIQGDRLAKYDGEYTYIFDFDDDVYVKYYVLKNGKIPAGYTLTKMRFWDEQTHNNVEDFAKMKFTFSTNLAAFERAIINNDKREFDAMSNIFEKDLDDYRNWKDRLDASDKANVKHVVEKINARLKASQFSKQFKLDDSISNKQVKDDEKTILFNLLTKYGFKILRQGKTWSGRTHIEFTGDFFDEDDKLRVFSEAKRKIDRLDSEATQAGLRMTFNIGLGKDRIVGSIDSEPMHDSTYSEVTNELKSELSDKKTFNEKALKAIKIIKTIK